MRRLRGAIGDLFEPELVLPSQFTTVRGEVCAGTRALMLAVLELAVRDFQLYATAKAQTSPYPFAQLHWQRRKRNRELLDWFRSDAQDHPFTFVSLCDTFGLDPEAVRARLAQRDWRAGGSLTHMHATVQLTRQLHGGYRAGGRR